MTSSGRAGFVSSALEDRRPSQEVFSGRLRRCEKLISFRGRRRKIFSPDSYAAGAGATSLTEPLMRINRDQPIHRDRWQNSMKIP
jgi:hypothetical protein